MRLKHLLSVFLTLLTLSVGQMWGAVTALALPKTWDASDGKSAYTEALGCTFSTSFASDYSSAPKLKFNSEGAYLIIQVADAPDEISFNFKQNGTNAGTFKVQESTDGSTYTDALTVTWPGNGSTASRSTSLNASTRYIKLAYVSKGNSTNAGVGGISITKAAATCSTPPTVGTNLTSVSATTNSITATVPISSIGGCNITENGLVYSTTAATPTVGGTGCTKVTTTACGATAANKTVTINELACGTTYYVRGFATNGANTSYTNVTTQVTSACLVDHFIDDVQSTTGYTGVGMEKVGDYSESLPTIADKTAGTGNCQALHYHFCGWVTEANRANPHGHLATINGTATGTTYYAVWSRGSGSGGPNDFTLVESSQDDWSGTYLFVNYSDNDHAMSSDLSSGKFASVEVEPSNKVITCTNNKLIWTLAKGTGDNASKYSVKSNQTNTYAGIGSGSTTGSLNNDAQWLSLSYDNNHQVKISGSSGRNFSYYSNNTDFRTYSSANGFYLYKKNDVTYSDSVTVCCTELGQINGSFFWPTLFSYLTC